MTQPLLFRQATTRTTGEAQSGRYDASKRIWVFDGQHSSSVTCETMTKTKVQQESDDVDGLLDLNPVELMTKTEVQQESDDEDPTTSLDPLELRTKTAVTQETDDDGRAVGITAPELLTKTDVQQESDDQADGNGVLQL